LGKKDHGRLVHEIREALIKHDFKPTAVTQLETAEGSRAVRSPGFKLEKHNDGKSVRLSHRLAVQPSNEALDWQSRQAMGGAQMKRLIRYNEALEQEGFICLAINSRDPLTPYSLWRRTDDLQTATPKARKS
jgi:hypothetical protein